MIDHTGINVSNVEKSKDFYSAVLLPLHYEIRLNLGSAYGFGAKTAKSGDDPGGDFWISQGTPHTPRNHIAFRATYAAYVFDPDGYNIEAVYHG